MSMTPQGGSGQPPGTDSDPGDITPESKIGRILERYPELEDVLIEMSPAFSKLRNPVLRKTVARVATLRQVAGAGKVDLGTLVNRLRKAAGLEQVSFEGGKSPAESSSPPDWFSSGSVVKTFDARPVIGSGGHPLTTVLEDIGKLDPGQIYELVTPFLPVPLIERVREMGFSSWSRTDSSDLVRTFIAHSDS